MTMVDNFRYYVMDNRAHEKPIIMPNEFFS